MSHAVELTEVSKSFGAKRAVDGLSLAVPEGSIYGFIGPNGSGKTTTLRLILRIYQPDAGQVAVLGSPAGNVADDRLGYLPEERGLYKRMKAASQIEYFARLKGCRDCRPAMNQWLERLGAASFAHQRVDALSKGMAQKIQFIAAVIARPKVLILDEPFSGLDPVNLDLLRDAVRELRREGTTIIFSTHDMHVAEELCDSVMMIFEGRKVLDGTLADIQRAYPVNQVKFALTPGTALPRELPGVSHVEADGAGHILHLAPGATPQETLRRLVASCDVERFEVVRPTLHDIFVDQATAAGRGAA